MAEYAVRKTLLAQSSDSPYVRLIVMPSFEPEWMVEVSEPSGGAAQIRLVVTSRPVWNGGQPEVQSVGTRLATLNLETAELLRRTWIAMLRGFESRLHRIQPLVLTA
jgi:hypothetical protein